MKDYVKEKDNIISIYTQVVGVSIKVKLKTLACMHSSTPVVLHSVAVSGAISE